MTTLRTRPRRPLPEESFCVYGFGVTGHAVAAALVRRGLAVVACDDRGDPTMEARAREIDVELLHPDVDELDSVLEPIGALLPAPGLPEAHRVFESARRCGATVLSEFDLAAAWDDRPLVAITGTNGKTTVTTMVTEMLRGSGIVTTESGNNDLPLVTALDDDRYEMFVVEASSFRLGHSRYVSPAVGTWLNFAPDHLDVHRSLEHYERAKARVWSEQMPGDVAVANADDAVVMAHADGPARLVTFGSGAADYRVEHGRLVGPDGVVIVETAALRRQLPHDVANALAAAATADAAGATPDAVERVLTSFEGLRHRVEFVGCINDLPFYDDSKATTPHATAAAVSGFESVVLIAGGRNKGLDLSPLGRLAPPVRAVVGIGDAATEVVAAFGDLPHVLAATMSDAVDAALELSHDGDAVVLSPGCASFDWYRNYHERGEDFVRIVRERAS